MFRRIALLTLTALAALTTLTSALPTLAQEDSSQTTTITEDDINASYRVTNPFRRSLSDVYVDLQDGQVQISATLTSRREGAHAIVATYTPSIGASGRLEWTLVTMTYDGESAPDSIISAVNNSLRRALYNAHRDWLEANGYNWIDVTGITVSETEVTITWERVS